MADAAENLPSTGTGNFPHIPYYAIGCSLERIAAESNGRMKLEVIGQSALGRSMYGVTINELSTSSQRRDYLNWQVVNGLSRSLPGQAQRLLDGLDGNVKVPLFIQGGIHGNEYEGVDAAMQLIERLATTPYGTDPEVDRILDHSVVIFNPIQNPDGRIAGTRANGNGFDLNRDYLTQAQSESKASVELMQKWQPPEVLDLHGYVTPTLIEATTKPHNPSIEYDLWLKWNQGRIDANEAALNAEGLLVTRPINDWCADGSIPEGGVCDDGTSNFGPRYAESWDDWGPFYTAMYAQHVGLNSSTVEMCNGSSQAPGSDPPRTRCGPLLGEGHKVGRSGARLAQYLTVWSSLLYDTANRSELLNDEMEIYRRGVEDEPRPACCPPPFDVANNWMQEYPKAYVIPVGNGQRSDPEANRLVDWLLFNGIEVEELKQDLRLGTQTFERNSYVVWLAQARRGLLDTALGIGQDISEEISILYAPPAAWSHGYLWGADVVTIPDSASFIAKTKRILQPNRLRGGVEPGRADRYALEVDSPTAVRALNALLAAGTPAGIATASFGGLPAGTAVFSGDRANRKTLDAVGEERGLVFARVAAASVPPLEPVAAVPRIAVLNGTGRTDQSVWSLRNLGFTANPFNTGALNTAATSPLDGYDAVFNASTSATNNQWPSAANPIARARLTSFFAGGGGYIGANLGGATFLGSSAELAGLAAAANSGGGSGYSGIVNWTNSGPGTSVVTGAYRSTDTAIMDPPTWFTGVPASMTVDGSLPLTGFFLSGLWPGSATSPGAPGAAVIAHGTNTAGTARIASFAMNPLYRADPEREWPMLASAAYWVDQ